MRIIQNPFIFYNFFNRYFYVRMIRKEGEIMGIVCIAVEIVLLFAIYQTRKIYKNGDTILFSNDSEFLEELPEDIKGEFIQKSRAITLKMYYCLMFVPPFLYVLYICNFNNMSMIIFTLIVGGGIMFYILNQMIQLQNEYKSKRR